MRKCIVFESRTQDGGRLRRQEAEDVRMAKGLNGIPGERDGVGGRRLTPSSIREK